MSHFSCLVISKPGQTIEQLLAPYQENNMGNCPKQYLAFYDVTDEYMEEYEEGGVEMVKTPEGELVHPWNEIFRKPGTAGHGTDTHEVPEGQGYEKVFIKHKDRFKDFDEFMQNWAGCKKDQETGRYGYWENPNKKWDWWVIGGRWSGMLKTKNGAVCNQAMASEIDWETINKEKRLGAERTWAEMEGKSDSERYWEGGIEKDETREDFIKRSGTFATFAVITPDGKWHGYGRMGWWAMVFDNQETHVQWAEKFHERFLANCDPEYMLTIVDLHI